MKRIDPTIPLHDKRFVYTPSHQTDIRKTFAKARRALGKPDATVTPIGKVRA